MAISFTEVTVPKRKSGDPAIQIYVEDSSAERPAA